MLNKNQLDNIILNKGESKDKNKLLLLITVFGIILIVTVLLISVISYDDSQDMSRLEVDNNAQFKKPIVNEDAQEENPMEDEYTDAMLTDIDEDAFPEFEEEKISIQQPIVQKKKPRAVKKVFYIQVGSFARLSPDAKFLNTIKSAGFNYKLKKVRINSGIVNKVLIGPFSSKQKARSVINKIRIRIEPGAFIVQI